MFWRIISYYKNLIWGNRRWFFVITAVFLVSVLIGVLVSLFATSFSEQIIASYVRSIKPDLKEGWDLTLFIYQRNLTITTLASVFSFFFGIAAIFVTFINGLLLGLIFGYPKIYSLANPLYFVALIVPHGILEYFATFLSLAFGLRLGINWTLITNQGKRKQTFFKNFRELLTILVLVGFILFLAAFIEGFLTRRIADCLFGHCSLKF